MFNNKRMSIIVIAAVLMVGGLAQALNEIPYDMHYTGAYCRPYNPAHDSCTTINDIYGWIGNQCEYSIEVICPLGLVKEFLDYNLTQVTNTQIWYIDDSTANFECDLVVRDNDSGSNNTLAIDPPARNNQTIYDVASGTNKSYVHSYGPTFIRCKIPKNDGTGGISWIVGYSVRMNAGDDT